MDLFTIDDLHQLMTARDGLRFSMYFPTYRAGAETQQNPIRLKNLLQQAQERLEREADASPQEASALLEPAYALLGDRDFWEHQSDGLAVFLTDEGEMRTYRLPLSFDETLVIGDRFHIKPLLPLLSGDGKFYVLALSQGRVWLLQGTRYTVDEIDLESVPESIADALWYDITEKQQQAHSVQRGDRSGDAGMYHGHGATGEELDKEKILRFFRQVNDGVQEFLNGSSAPLVLAGVEYLHPIYRKANTYPNLLDRGLTGNFDDAEPQDLHQDAWELVEGIFARGREEAVAAYKQLAGTERASDNLSVVLPAAHYGRVDMLFVQKGEERWGTFDPATGTLNGHSEPAIDGEDLLDLAAVQTLSNSGTVYSVEADDMPGAGPVAAIFRY